MRAYRKDIIRSIVKGRKRFFALMLITALGVCMFGGIKAGCDDLRYSADLFFDEQNLYDISIVSTMGLTEADVEAVAGIEGVEEAEGTYSEDVYTDLADGSRKQATVKTLSEKGINMPYLLEGKLPETAEEILVTEKYINESGKQIGDTVCIAEKQTSGESDDTDDLEDTDKPEETDGVIEEKETDFVSDSYRICGVAIDVMDINSTEGAVSFRNNSTTDYIFYVHKDAVVSDIYTAMYLTLEGTDALACYTDAYEQKVDETVTFLEDEIKEDREQARYTEVTDEAMQKLIEKENEMWDAFDKAEQGLADARAEIADARKTLEDSEDKLTQSERELTQAERELLKSERELERGENQLLSAEQQISSAESQIQVMELLLNEAEELFASLEESGSMPSDNEYVELIQQQLTDTRTELAASKAELAAGKAEISDAKEQMQDGWNQIEKGWNQLEAGEQQIYDGWDKLEDGQKELEEGEKELEEGVAEYESEKEEALQKIEDAKKEISDLKMTEWYITTRTSLSGYSNIKTDADCIEAIGQAFPILFMTIAILISLTTMSRMIEEDRGLIGTYKALGFTDDEIRRKYMLYALIACIFGGILGDMLAYLVLPEIMFIVFGVMYQLPAYYFTFDILYGIGGILLFIIGIVGAAYVSCNSVLKSVPAALMRAKAPSLGSRVLLERITPVWSRLSFLNKVTARNLFRYKKRLFMTLFGIAGCTALLLAGFTIRDTVVELLPLQYEETFRYDVLVVAEDNEKLLNSLEGRSDIRKYINTMVSNVKLIAESGREETVQLVVIPEDENISRYIRLYDDKGERQKLTDDDVFVTTNLSMVLDFAEEDFVIIQNMNLVQTDVEVTKVVMNYLGNSIYMTQAMYEESFDEAFEPNAAYVLLSTKEEKHSEFVEEMKGKDGILTVMGTQDMIAGFDSAFYIINMVVYIIIILAGALAFVVLFTLATTNISERERELATIKVLGFYDGEVHSYVNKETLILTGIGIFMGMPLGKIMGIWLMGVLEMPSIYFYPSLYPQSYAYAAIIAVCFALLVNLMTNKSLNKIDPVEALKSVE